MTGYNSFQELAQAQGWDEARQHEELSNSHYDLYKTVNGIRPRWIKYETMTIEELIKDIEALSKEQADDEAWEAQRLEELAQEHASAVRCALIHGAPDHKTAERWLKQAVNY